MTVLGDSTAQSEMDLTLSILIEGEQRSVTFTMDPGADTPDAVAAEMIEELHLSPTDGAATKHAPPTMQATPRPESYGQCCRKTSPRPLPHPRPPLTQNTPVSNAKHARSNAKHARL